MQDQAAIAACIGEFINPKAERKSHHLPSRHAPPLRPPRGSCGGSQGVGRLAALFPVLNSDVGTRWQG